MLALVDIGVNHLLTEIVKIVKLLLVVMHVGLLHHGHDVVAAVVVIDAAYWSSVEQLLW